jgi:hypothetical protein
MQSRRDYEGKRCHSQTKKLRSRPHKKIEAASKAAPKPQSFEDKELHFYMAIAAAIAVGAAQPVASTTFETKSSATR